MRQVKWRGVLPVVQLTIYLALVWDGCWYRPTWQYWLEKWMYPASEPAGFAAEWIHGFVPLSEQVAAGLNLPAAAAAVISLAPFEGDLRSGAAKELAIHAVTALYIPFLWYLIGNRIDNTGNVRRPLLSRPRKLLAVSLIAGLLLAVVGVLSSFAVQQNATMAILSLLWILSGLALIASGLRRSATGDMPR